MKALQIFGAILLIALLIPIDGKANIGAASSFPKTAVIIPPPSVQKRLLSQMAKELPVKASIRLENWSMRISVPAQAQVQINNPHPPLGVVSFETYWTEQGKPRRAFGSVTSRVTAPVAVVKAPIRHGEDFNDSNIEFQPRDLTVHSTTGYFLEKEKLSTVRASGYLKPGNVLGLNNTMAPNAIEAGQMVDLVHQAGLLRITAKVKALQSGQTRQWVKVENPTTKKSFLAKVTGPAEVHLR